MTTRTSLAALLLAVVSAHGAAQEPPRDKPKPDAENVRYGPHERNVLDLWLARSDRRTPLVLFIHGGGFRTGDKSDLSDDRLRTLLDSGFSVASLNYRLIDAAPMPAAYLDGGRALQFLRANAAKWNLDPTRVASTGVSAGGAMSMWLAFHDDLADPKSDDIVARQSTRLSGIAVDNAQSSIDPRFAEKIGIPRPNFERHPSFLTFYGITAGEIDTPKAYQLYDRAAPITYLTADDPPALLNYGPPDEDVTLKTPLDVALHHPRFGIAVKRRMDKLGIECIVQYEGQASGRRVSVADFLRKHLARRP